MTSEFVEGDDVDRLDFIFELFDLFLDKVCRNLIIFNCCADLNLKDTVSDGLLLPFSLPEETIHLDSENLVCECLKIGFLSPWLYLPNDKRFGDRGSLLLFALSFLHFLFH